MVVESLFCESVWIQPAAPSKSMPNHPHCLAVATAEEVGHDFCGMQVKLSRAIGKALFLLTQRVELG